MRIVAPLALLLLPLFAQQRPPQPEPDQTPTIKVDVDLVNLFFAVRDRKGLQYTALERQGFEIFEDGKPVEVRSFTRETDLPLTIGLLIDVSGSQGALIEEERSASLRFFSQILRQKDMAFIISFGADTELLQDFTNSKRLLQEGLGQLKMNAAVSGYSPTGGTVPTPGGTRGTALYDAVWLAAKEKLRSEVGRKALVLISDGNDVGSRTRIEKAIEEAHKADTIIYAILFEDPRYTSRMFGGISGEGPMRKLAEETGGRVFRVDRRNRLDDIYNQIQLEMRSQYAAAFSPANPNHDGGFRKIEIRLKEKDLKAQVRKGYFAPSE